MIFAWVKTFLSKLRMNSMNKLIVTMHITLMKMTLFQKSMCFETLDAVKVFYRNFAIHSGFGVRIRSSLRGVDNEINYIKLVCSHEGNYVSAIPQN